MIKKDALFVIFSFLCVGLVFSFHFWLFWPGWIQDDSQTAFMLLKHNWHPVILPWLLQGMYKLFGIHIYHLFLLTLIPFYSGIWIIIYTFYKKTKSFYSVLALLPFCISNIFYAEASLGRSSFQISWLLLLYAIIVYIVVNPTNKLSKKRIFLYIILGIAFIIALLSGHEAIIQVWPATFVFIGLYLKKKNFNGSAYAKRFILLSITSGIICTCLLYGINGFLTRSDKGNVYPQNHIILHQIVGSCAPDFDESCFNPDWWMPSVNNSRKMQSLNELYQNKLLFADAFYMSIFNERFFKSFTQLDGIYSKWGYAIVKHPKNYIKHQARFYKALWLMNAGLPPNFFLVRQYSSNTMYTECLIFTPLSSGEKQQLKAMSKKFLKNELKLNWSYKKYRIDNFLRKHLTIPGMIWFVMVNFISFFAGCILYSKNEDDMLILTLVSVSFAGVLGNIIIPAFCPIPLSRYMNPIIICAVLSLMIIVLRYSKEKSHMITAKNQQKM